jgi:hypothetical protein
MAASEHALLVGIDGYSGVRRERMHLYAGTPRGVDYRFPR